MTYGTPRCCICGGEFRPGDRTVPYQRVDPKYPESKVRMIVKPAHYACCPPGDPDEEAA